MSATVVAMGGGGFSMNGEITGLDRYLLAAAGVPSPRVCFVGTAAGDSDDYVARFFAAMGTIDCRPSFLPLFRRTASDLGAVLADVDVVYVGGGNTANLLVVWRRHGFDAALRARATHRHLVVGGLSAGGLCWFDDGMTDSLGPPLQPLGDGLGWIAGSFCPHYDGEAERRPTYHQAVASGAVVAGIACDDGAAVRYVDGAVVEHVTERSGALAYAVGPDGAGGATETPLPTRSLNGGA